MKAVKEEIRQRLLLDRTNHIITERLVVFARQSNLCSSAEAGCGSQLSTLVEVNLGRTLKSLIFLSWFQGTFSRVSGLILCVFVCVCVQQDV